jgi:Domain of unknown function (DUF4265)
MVKIAFTYNDLEDNIAIETVWAEPIGIHYKIDNIPFYFSNIALNDIVSAEMEDGQLHFNELITPSGFSTIQIIIFNATEKANVITALEKFNCPWEGMNELYLAVAIPPKVNYQPIKDYLTAACNADILDYSEACISKEHSQVI